MQQKECGLRLFYSFSVFLKREERRGEERREIFGKAEENPEKRRRGEGGNSHEIKGSSLAHSLFRVSCTLCYLS